MVSEAAEPSARPSGQLSFPAEIRSLTSLRYLAAVWVVLFHWSAFFPETALAADRFVLAGYLGVDFFFILSGFVLAHVYLPRQLQGRLDYWNFVSRRVARIYPMHLLTLVGMVGFGVIAHRQGWQFAGPWQPDEFFALGSGEVPREIFAHLLMIHAWGATDGLHFNMPSWSISAEWFAYLTFPLATFALSAMARRPAMVLSAVLAAILAYAVVLQAAAGRDVFDMTWNIGVLRIVPDFVLGVAIYRYGLRYSHGAAVTLGGIALAAGAVLAIAYLQAPKFLMIPAFAAIIFFAADRERQGGMRVLGHPFAVLLGEVSYSVYMLHFGFGIALFGGIMAPWLGVNSAMAAAMIGAGLIGVTFASWLAHRFFELPARNYLNRKSSQVMNQVKPAGVPHGFG